MYKKNSEAGPSRRPMRVAAGSATALAALFIAGVSLSPVASASVAIPQAQSVSHRTTAANRPETIYYLDFEGTFPSAGACEEAGEEAVVNPYAVSYTCVDRSGTWYLYVEYTEPQ